MSKNILSLFDFSGVWSQPYVDKGYAVTRLDIQTGGDVLTIDSSAYLAEHGQPQGILAAPPCTDFASSGARWWADKDKDGRTGEALRLIDATLAIVDVLQPAWWALENPVGRLTRLRPQLGKPWYFQPWWYGDAYTKKTGLWGDFNRDMKRNEVETIMYESAGKRGSWQWAKLGGKSERTKRLRSQTPRGFAHDGPTAETDNKIPNRCGV